MAKCLKSSDGKYVIHCPGCGHGHQFDARWQFSGDYDSPTFTPSHVQEGARGRCHIYVTKGVIQFLGDCQHPLAGQSVLLEDW